MKAIIYGIITTLILTLPSQAEKYNDTDIKQLALEAILENPEIIKQAINILQNREEKETSARIQQAWEANREFALHDRNAPVLGNPNGDVTLIEFFDYNCGYCKRAGTIIKAILADDKNLRIILREFPILSKGSHFAAQAALASRNQNRYEEFHWALMAAPHKLDESSVMNIAKELNLDIEKLRADMQAPEVDSHIQTSHELANTLQISGTPTFIIGNKIIPGYIKQENLIQLISQIRDN